MEYIKYTPELSNNWSRALSGVAKQKPWAMQRVEHSMTASQLESKLWLGTELLKAHPEPFNNAMIIGGWFCQFLAEVLASNNNVKFMCNYDICKESQLISYKFNRRLKDSDIYMASARNVFTMRLENTHIEKGEIDLVINTSCEHMFPMQMIKDKHFKNTYPLCVLQSTDDDQYNDHINIVKDLDELIEQAGLIDIKYAGEKILSNGMKRFMVIGR
jgi:hypothetical protein